VRTAVDDFVKQSAQSWQVVDIPGLNGVGVLFAAAAEEAQEDMLAPLVRQLRSRSLLDRQARRVEVARVTAERNGAEAGRREGTLAEELEGAGAQLAAERRGHEEALETAGEDAARLRELLADADARFDALVEELEGLAPLRADLVEAEGRIAALDEAERLVREQADRQVQKARSDERAARERATELSLRIDFLNVELARARMTAGDRDQIMSDRQAALERLERFRAELDRVRDDHERMSRLQARELRVAQAKVAKAAAERAMVQSSLEAVAASRSWRWGHRFFVFLRLVTFRRTHGKDAVTNTLQLLDGDITS